MLVFLKNKYMPNKKYITCGSCEETSPKPDKNNNCPKCGSGNWVFGDIDEDIDSAIKEEIDAYLAINGETGEYGETTRDQIGVDTICEQIQSGHDIEITDEIRDKVEELLII